MIRDIVDSAKRHAQQKAAEREELETLAEGYYDDDSSDEDPEVRYLDISKKGALEAAKRDMQRLPALMYLAEIPRNSEQSYRDSGLSGPIVWFFAESEHETDETDEPLYHPGFYDLAAGLSRKEMYNHLGRLRASGGNTEGKHGIGARISALRASPEGCEWWSLKDGEVNGFKLWLENGTRLAYQVFENYETDAMHPEIVKAGHGTQVVFTGIAPLPANKMPTEFTARWLSARWYDRPANITMKVQRSSGALGTVPTQKEALEALSEFSVDVGLSDAHVKVYVLKPDHSDVPLGQRYYYANLYRTKDGESGRGARPRPKFFVVYDNEIYDKVRASGTPNRLRSFGITHGHQRVVMLVFPTPDFYGPNDVRTGIEPLTCDDVTDVKLPMERWAKEFQEAMPQELRAYVEAQAIGTQEQNMEVINSIITEHAQYLTGGCGGKNRVTPGEGDDEGESAPPEGPEKKKKKKKKKKPTKKKKTRKPTKGRKVTKNRFSAPRVVWVEPDPSDDLYIESGIYLPGANDGRGELHLNRCWKPLKKWQAQLEHHEMLANLTPIMIEHYTQQAMALIHVDAVMRSRIGKLPDPTADEFKGAMLLPNCRDMALREVIKVSSRIIQ